MEAATVLAELESEPTPEGPVIDATRPEARTLESDHHEAIASERARHDAVLSRLKDALAASEPGMDAALIAGTTLAEVEESFAAAREVVRRVREDVRREAAAVIPAGAHGRIPAPRLTPFEKIRAGMSRLA